jgi:hypothetical protein
MGSRTRQAARRRRDRAGESFPGTLSCPARREQVLDTIGLTCDLPRHDSGNHHDPHLGPWQASRCPGPPHAGHASSDWSCPLDDADDIACPPGPRGANVDYPDIYRLACRSALYAGIAEEALNLLGLLDRQPGNRVLILQRAGELRRQLDTA